MLRCSSELYIGEGIASRADGILSRLQNDDFTDNAWLLTLSTNKSNQVDIIHTVFLKERWIRKSLPMIVGIAATKPEAMRLIARILEDSLKTHCGADIRAYLVEKHYTEP